jgi:uncharacterized protein YjeT (DUF2065 family)
MNMMQQVLTAIALYMIIEGMIPFVGPGFFRRNVVRLAELDDNHLRVVGLMVTLIGLGMLYLIRL